MKPNSILLLLVLHVIAHVTHVLVQILTNVRVVNQENTSISQLIKLNLENAFLSHQFRVTKNIKVSMSLVLEAQTP